MRKTKIIVTLLCLWLGLMPLAAQSVTITKDFAQVPMASVLAMYKNQFGKWEKPDLDITFPYAVVRMHLEGSGREVTMAKQTLTLYMGTQSAVLDRYTENSNEILFLIPARRPTVYVDCGDGCDRVLLVENQQLQPNSVYDCTVQFVPEEEYVAPVTTQAPKRQFFKFRVTPADAIVEVDVNGQKDMWPVSDGVASKPLNYGSYRYTISANRYHTESGEFVVSDTETEKTVSLRPKFGYLYITSNVAQGAYVYATNLLTGARQSLGTVPVNGKDLDSGTYSILIQKDKYKDYTATITIDDEQTTTLNPTLEANFVQLTLTTSAQSDMYIDGQKLGTGRWTGTLELGKYSVETRQASHQSAYTTLRVTSQSAGQTIALNNPIPIYGSMVLTSSPADAVVYIDDKKVGTSPVIVNELLVGTHTIRLEKDGYDQQEKTVQIAENQESMLDFTLTKTVAKAPIVPAAPQGGAVETITVKGVSFNMIKVQGGTFTMGATVEQGSDAWDGEKPTHQVTLSDYYIGETEVTQELWQAVMGTTIQEQAKKGTFETSLNGVGNSYPMYYISWDDCQTFVKKLNQLTGKNFRLPTEAEWEYAARGGQKSRGYKYAGSNTLSDVAWYTGNSGSKTHPVKQKQANELGLYDMSGNVLEWCQDWSGSYSSNAQTNPTGPSSGSYRVCRGGCWSGSASGCRVAYRSNGSPGDRHYSLGFRVVLLP